MGRFLQLENVTFAYPGMTEPLFGGVTVLIPEGAWTGVVGANGAGKTTLLKLAAGELSPTEGTVRRLGSAQYVVQRTDRAPDEWDEFMNSWDDVAIDVRVRLGVRDEWADRWDTLSHGERKRVQIAIALWHRPDVLALDEPTNHLDGDAKRVLLATLKAYRGAGLVVSHDRDFLDALCGQCLFVFPPRVVMRPGSVTRGLEADRNEQFAAQDEHDSNAAKARRIRAAAQERRESAEQSAARTNRLKNAKQPIHDHDGRAKRQLAALTNKDGWGFSQSSALKARASKLEAADPSIRVDYKLGFWLDNAGVSSRNYVLDIPAGEIPLGDGRTLVHPALKIRPDERIALMGANGLGKSTLLKALIAQANLEPERMLCIPQEITEDGCRAIQEAVKKLEDEPLGRIMTLVSRLGSRPGRLLASVTPSPGEVRKLLLAQGVSRGPHLIVLDEPTNHLDLPSIGCLEDALKEAPCAMLIVSHDERFVDALGCVRWNLAVCGDRVVLGR